MAIGWLTVLKLVPWTDVIANAPKVVEGAKGLWQSVSGRRRPDIPVRPPAPDAGPTEIVHRRLDSLDSAVADLHAQMVESTRLLKSLAEQNAQLVARLEAQRRQMRWLAAGLAVVALIGVAGWMWR